MGDLKYIPFEEESEDIKPKVTEYWTQRADSFCIQKQHELESDKSLKWKREIIQKISEAYGDSRELNILDVGCGVGFFTVLLGKEGYNVTGIDLTEYMIEKAGMMIAYNGPYRGTVTAMTMDTENLLFEDGFFDGIISNPPYIRTEELPHLQKEVQCEPAMALDGGTDGLMFYRIICEKWLPKLKKGGIVSFETGEDQGAQVCSLLEKSGAANVRIVKDISGLDRTVTAVMQ